MIPGTKVTILPTTPISGFYSRYDTNIEVFGFYLKQINPCIPDLTQFPMTLAFNTAEGLSEIAMLYDGTPSSSCTLEYTNLGSDIQILGNNLNVPASKMINQEVTVSYPDVCSES